MIVPDVNLLLYAEIDAHPLHASARSWWEKILNGDRQVGLPAVCIFGFLRVSTNRRVFTEPLSAKNAIERVQRWLDRETVSFLVPGSRHLELAFGLLESLGTGANLTADVQIAPDLAVTAHSNARALAAVDQSTELRFGGRTGSVFFFLAERSRKKTDRAFALARNSYTRAGRRSDPLPPNPRTLRDPNKVRRTMHTIRISFLLGTATLLAFGCASANDEPASEDVRVLTDSLGAELSPVSKAMVLANEAAERKLNLILRVQTRPGMLFEVYEPEPGVLVYSGGGSRETAVPAPSKAEHERYAAAIDAALTGSGNAADAVQEGTMEGLDEMLVETLARHAPQSLELPEVEAAVERQRERFEAAGIQPPGPSLAEAKQLVRETLESVRAAALAEARAPEGFDAPMHVRKGGFIGGYCDEEYFDERWPDYPLASPPGWCWDFESDRCEINYQDGTLSKSNDETKWGLTNACSAFGTVTLATRWRGNDEITWELEENYWRWYRVSDPLCVATWDDCPYFRSEVRHATGNRYHWHFYVDEGHSFD